MIVTATLAIAGSSAVYVSSNIAADAACEIAGSCGRCGDGQCVKSCGENAKTCPQDCGGGGVPTTK